MPKTLRNVLLLILLVIVLIISGYFIFSYNFLSDKNIAQEEFANAVFETADRNYVLGFGEDNINMKIYENDIVIDLVSIEYTENIFKFNSSDRDFYFIVIDVDTLYNKEYNQYFYRIKRLS